MTITIQAPPEVEEKLVQAAAQEGVSIEDYALQAVLQKADEQRHEHSEPDWPASQDAVTQAQLLFAQWTENPTDAPEEIARRRREASEILERLTRDNSQDKRPFQARATPDEWTAALKAYAYTHDPNLPAFTDEELRRENLYDDRI